MHLADNSLVVPFDEIFRVNGAQLRENYRVDLLKFCQSSNPEAAVDSEEFEAEEEEEEEEEAVEEGEDEVKEQKQKREEAARADEAVGEANEARVIGAVDSTEEAAMAKPSKLKPPRSKSSKKSKNRRKIRGDFEYDFDDPFIDDSEMTDVYQSVFDLMRTNFEVEGSRAEEKDESDEEADEEVDGGGFDELEGLRGERQSCKKKSTKSRLHPHREQNFFVYRGPLAAEILSKEFDISLTELEAADAIGSDEETSEGPAGGRGDLPSNSTKLKRKAEKKSKLSTRAEKSQKRVKTCSPPVPASKSASKSSRKPKNAGKSLPKPSKDAISRAAEKFSDLFCSEVVKENNDEGSNEAKAVINAAAVVFNVNGIDSNLLELREVLKRFRDLTRSTSFSPGKFPSMLRPLLNETIFATLRAFKATPEEPFPLQFYSALTAFLPFSSSALTKLLEKKILRPLRGSLEQSELPKLYDSWRVLLRARLEDELAFVQVKERVVEERDSTAATVAGAADQPPLPQSSLPASPSKRRLKFTDEMRQIVFEIVRAETDLNNLMAISQLLPSSSDSFEESDVNGLQNSAKPQSEANLRRIVYQKLVSAVDAAASTLTTTEISREFAAQKRKHEKRISKAAATILFGEAEIEEFLKPKDQTNNTAAAPTAIPTPDPAVNPSPPNPLGNLFDEEQHHQTQQPESTNISVLEA